ncbi:MAG: AmmeMemoRadiSam system protein A [Solobacterium sp.]|nr:AmmeMemoRadiSam system protein A [Solobacterium sp.]
MIIGAVMVPHPPIAVPEIGKGEEKKIQDTLNSFEKIADYIAEQKPDTIIVTTPHAVMYRDWFNISSGAQAHGSFANYRAGSVTFDVLYDEAFTDRLTDLCEEESFPAGTQYDRDISLDQGTMVPLYFINQKYRDYKLVRIGLSGFPLPMHYRFGTLIQKVCQESDKRFLIVASGDLSHCEKEDGPYGFKQEGPQYDARIMKDMGSASFEELMKYDAAFLNKAEECGHRSFTILGGILDGLKVTPHVLSHEATFGVGYGFVIYDIEGSDEERHFLDRYEAEKRTLIKDKISGSDAYVKLAAKTIREWVMFHRKPEVPKDLPKEMLNERAGVFVSIHEDGDLRGCIGTIEAVRSSIAEEIISNAVSACSRDPRFDPVREDELDYLEISVDVLSKAEVIQDKSLLDVKRYGVICSMPDGRRGLLLPNLDGVDTVEEQLRIACSKGGIRESEPYIMERFEVVRHE